MAVLGIERSRVFEAHRRHGVVSLSKTFYPLLGIGLNQEDK